ncbi:MAG: hypothetical protein JWP08_1637 [Bryobacterales bacterium]|nr:hypothetical protein [Bryobacterales bacterium]
MTQITVGDITGSVQLDISDKSLAAQSGLEALHSTASDVLQALGKPVSDSTFKGAGFGALFGKPFINLNGNTLSVMAGANSSLTVARGSSAPLFGSDDYDPIHIGSSECWLSFELDAALEAGVAVPLPHGFGVSFQAGVAPKFATYVLIPEQQAAAISLRQALENTVSAFRILNSAEDVLSIPAGVIHTSELAGTVAVGGSWALPVSVNQVSLADATLPFHAEVSVEPELILRVAGHITVDATFSIRFRRMDEGRIRIGLYKKHGTDFRPVFTAAAGIGVDVGGTDLVDTLLSAVDPGITAVTLRPDEVAKFNESLKASIDHSLAISLNAACSAANSDEAAMVYEIDISTGDRATRDAISEALHGQWTAISHLPNAKKIRNVVTETLATKFSLKLNLLGLYNYRSVAEFVKTMQVLTSYEDGSVTITDTATASEIGTASVALAVDGERLRKALYRGFVMTATYQALLTGIRTEVQLNASQDFLLYDAAMGYRQALKQLNAGEVLGAMKPEVKAQFPVNGSPVKHARFAANCTYSNSDVMHFFFSDPEKLTAHTAAELKTIGRNVLAALLDPQDTTDRERIQVLQSDAKWAEMDSNPARILPPFSADWYDITEWAEALAKAGRLLADAIVYGRKLPGDPTADPTFRQKRAVLAGALDGVTHKTRSAFEKAFPICVMATLAGVTSGPRQAAVFEAQWNSLTITSNKPAEATQRLTAVV